MVLGVGTPAAALNPEVELLILQARQRAVVGLQGRERILTAATAILFALAALALAVLDPASGTADPLLAVGFVAACALAARFDFEVGHVGVVPTQVVVFPMLFALPAGIVPLCVAVAYVASAGRDLWRDGIQLQRSAVRVGNAWHAVGPALVLVLAGDPAASWDRWPLLLGSFAASCAFDVARAGARGVALFGLRMPDELLLVRRIYAIDAVLALVGACIAVSAVDAPLVGFAGLPLIALLGHFASERRGRIDQALELSHAYRGTAFLLGDVVEADDTYTGLHSRRVVDLSLAVADDLGVDPATRRNVEFTALLHDVGKIRIPSEIINKPGPLTPRERAIVETHTIEGEKLLARVGGLLGEIGSLVRSCHERWDGGGYPDGLAGEQIPLVARIVACCDAYEAMTSDRSYRCALPGHEAAAELRRCAGTQFDPAVVDVLLGRISSPHERALDPGRRCAGGVRAAAPRPDRGVRGGARRRGRRDRAA